MFMLAKVGVDALRRLFDLQEDDWFTFSEGPYSKKLAQRAGIWRNEFNM